MLALELAPLLAPVLDGSCRGGGQGPGGFPPSSQPVSQLTPARLHAWSTDEAAPFSGCPGTGLCWAGWTRGADGGRGTYLTLAVRMRPACCKPVRAMYIRRISLVPCGQHYPGQRLPTSGQP